MYSQFSGKDFFEMCEPSPQGFCSSPEKGHISPSVTRAQAKSFLFAKAGNPGLSSLVENSSAIRKAVHEHLKLGHDRRSVNSRSVFSVSKGFPHQPEGIYGGVDSHSQLQIYERVVSETSLKQFLDQPDRGRCR